MICPLPVSDSERIQGVRGDEIIRLRDIATVSVGYQDPATSIMRMDGRPAIAWRRRRLPG